MCGAAVYGGVEGDFEVNISLHNGKTSKSVALASGRAITTGSGPVHRYDKRVKQNLLQFFIIKRSGRQCWSGVEGRQIG